MEQLKINAYVTKYIEDKGLKFISNKPEANILVERCVGELVRRAVEAEELRGEFELKLNEQQKSINAGIVLNGPITVDMQEYLTLYDSIKNGFMPDQQLMAKYSFIFITKILEELTNKSGLDIIKNIKEKENSKDGKPAKKPGA